MADGRWTAAEDAAQAAPSDPPTRLQRIAYTGSWVAAFAGPLLLFPVRSWLVQGGGWMSGPGLFLLAPPLFLALSLPPLLMFADPVAVGSHAVGRGFARASLVLWVTLLVVTLTVPEDFTGTPGVTLLGLWSGGRVDAGLVNALAGVALVVAVGAWLSAVGFATGAWLDARRRQPD